MAGSPRLAAIRRMACSEEAQGSSPVSRACRAASQLMAASGWPVLMLVQAVMVRRKASRCRKCPWLMISPAAAVSAGMPSAAIQDLYLESLLALGTKPDEHDVRFVEDDWESPTLGAWGLGWQVWLDGLEISQFTYFQQVGGIDCKPVSGFVLIGSTRSPEAPINEFTAGEWHQFVTAAKMGAFDGIA